MDIKELNINNEQHTTKNHPWEYARAKVIIHLLQKFLKKKKSLQYAIDIGCGDTFFLKQFCKKYCVNEAIAVDTAFDDTLIAKLKEKNPKITFVNNIDDIRLHATSTADVIFLMDVIEHIEDDIAFLKRLREADFISKDTLFVITVPAFNRLYCSHDKWLGHYRRYSQKTLQLAIQQAGLKSVHRGYFFTTLFFMRIIQKILEKIKGEPIHAPNGIGGWRGGVFISKLYEWFLLCDYYFFSIFLFFGIRLPGLSTFSICQKQ